MALVSLFMLLVLCGLSRFPSELLFQISRSATSITADPLGLLLQPLYIDGSKYPRVVCFNWNCRACIYFLLLLSGDVAINPGPNVCLCGLCEMIVGDEDKAVLCDSCDKWAHVSCDPALSDFLYSYMVQTPLMSHGIAQIAVLLETLLLHPSSQLETYVVLL